MTKDEDFALLQALDRTGPPVVWIRIGNAVRNVLMRRLPVLWPEVMSCDRTRREGRRGWVDQLA